MTERLKNFIIKFFTVNLLLKIASLVLSIFLWFLVMNINNPIEVKSFSIDLTILNEEILEENGIVLLNKDELEDKKIQLKIKATRQALSELNKKENRDKIIAGLDLEQFKVANIAEATEFLGNIKITLPTLPYSYEISSIDPVTVTVTLDNLITISKNVTSKKLGTSNENYLVSDVSLSPEQVEITGASSILNQIESVFVDVDVSNATSNMVVVASPVAYDVNGNEITGVSFTPQQILVEVPIYSKLNINVLEPKLQGTLKDGYFISNITYSPKEFTIFVSDNLLNTINTSITPIIDVSNLSETTDFTFNANEFFDSDDIFYEAAVKITVTVQVEQEESLNLDLNLSNISFENINKDFSAIILDTNNIILKLKGNASNLSKINENTIKGKVNLENLSVGTHRVKVDFELPEEVFLAEDVFLNILITNNISEETETENEAIENTVQE